MGTVDLIRKVDVAGPLAGPPHASEHTSEHAEMCLLFHVRNRSVQPAALLIRMWAGNIKTGVIGKKIGRPVINVNNCL